jgi:methylase of polypeptide subunit release factors
MRVSQQASALVQAKTYLFIRASEGLKVQRIEPAPFVLWMPVLPDGSIANKRRHMDRFTMIQTVGQQYLTSNIENNEFSYQQAFTNAHTDFSSIKIDTYTDLDIRFIDIETRVAVLIETKPNFDKCFVKAKKQLNAYMSYERALTGYKLIGIIANTLDNRIRVWRDCVSDETFLPEQQTLTSFSDYRNIVSPARVNNKEQVIKSTYRLNETLHGLGIDEKLRSQFVGTCILALKNHLVYKDLSTAQILQGIYDVLSSLLNDDLNRANKLSILHTKVLQSQKIRQLKSEDIALVLDDISKEIMPYINEETTKGQDLLNLFFTTFNKYVGKADKNQAFTPDHIVSFMCDVIGVNRNSRVLDPCCGSGAFLVRAMTNALNDCQNQDERIEVKKHHIYGIEKEEAAFGLSTTNMLIHSDGNSNVVMESCFDLEQWIKDAHIDRVLMNPPYNAQRPHCQPSYVKQWKKDCKEDPSKGLHYLYYIAETVGTGKLAVLLPMQCAIGDKGDIKKYTELMMQHHRLDAVFSLPSEMFYPGASVVACCMIWELGVRHETANTETFFGYFKEDGFIKRKNLGRVERIDPQTGEGAWGAIHDKWLNLYKTRTAEVGLSAVKKVTFENEWCAEAYMETDYSTLSEKDFIQKLVDYSAFLVQNEEI